MRRRTIALGVVAAAALGAIAVTMRAQRRAGRGERAVDAGPAGASLVAARPGPAAAPPSSDAPSNVTAADYVGPAACAGCHPDNAARWRQSLHATMNQRASAAAIIGDFDGATLAYGGGEARFERRGDAFRMVLRGARGATRAFRVTRTIGTRGLQEYVGVDEAAPEAPEVRLPFGWWRARAGWYPQPYYDSWFDAEWRGDAPAFDAFAPDPTPWATRCPWCHNTYPFALRLARPGVGHGPERDLEAAAPAIAGNLLPVDALVTVGISCESCHLGGRAHAADDRVPPRFAPAGAPVARRADAPPPRERDTNLVCAQCHAAPTPRYPDGSAARNSSEALDLAAGACASALRCVDCHDPHQRGPEPGGADRPAHVAACVRCHADLPADHAHHDGVTCLDCHLPRIVQGIGAVVRSHRVSSPGDPAMLAAGAPNACNLCHLDRSIRWTVAELARWGVVRTAEPAWRTAYGGDLDYAVGPAWLASREPYVRLVAAAAYARAGDRDALPLLAAGLDDPVANTRMWILFAVEDLLGRRLRRDEYDPLAAPALRARQLTAWRRRLAQPAR